MHKNSLFPHPFHPSVFLLIVILMDVGDTTLSF